MSLVVRERPSPNFNERNADVPLRYIMLHYTDMLTCDAALDRLCDPAAEVSAHYVIDEEGLIFRLVDGNKRAWHAGKSFWRRLTDLNSASIGIELVNPGHQNGYRPFPAAQIKALKILLADLIQRHALSPTQCLLAHSDVAPGRRPDPGELFPWPDLAKAGFGVWPTDDKPAPPHANATEFLQEIGYDVSDLPAALLAFQRRFAPQNMTGKADALTLNRLTNVAAAFRHLYKETTPC